MNEAILLFDRSAILSTDGHFWRGVSGLGTCTIPRSVLDEINSVMSGFATDKSYEAIASEFQRFLPLSYWQVSDISSKHPALNQKLGNSASRNSRLDLEIAECAYGLALQSLNSVILVTNTNSLLQTINDLNHQNLSAATVATVGQWAQNHQIPTLKSPSFKTPTSRAVTVRNANSARLNKFIVGLIGWIVIATIGLVAWRSIQPKEFNKFWQKTGLPNLIK